MIPVPKNVLKSLASKYEIRGDDLSYFGGGKESSDGIVYKYPFDKKHRLLKIQAIPVEDQRTRLFCLKERMRFVRYLKENDVNIIVPQLSPKNNLYETYSCEEYKWVGYCMELIPGKVNSERIWDPGFFRNWGQLIGKCHRLASKYPSWRTSVDSETGMELLTWQLEWENFYEWCQDKDVKNEWVNIRLQLESLPMTQDVFGFIHNDPHIWNLLVDGKKITLLDFDVANHHWFINDLAIACQNTLIFMSGGLNRPLYQYDKLVGFLRSFIEGYQLEHDLPPEWLNRMDLFIAYRRILMFIAMNEWIRSNPKSFRSWKRMIMSQSEIIGNWV